MTDNSNNSFILYTSYLDTLEKLPVEEVGKVTLAIMHYAKDGTLRFYVKNGQLVEGLMCKGTPKRSKVVYPYEWNPECNRYRKMSGVTATYGCYENYLWK